MLETSIMTEVNLYAIVLPSNQGYNHQVNADCLKWGRMDHSFDSLPWIGGKDRRCVGYWTPVCFDAVYQCYC